MTFNNNVIWKYPFQKLDVCSDNLMVTIDYTSRILVVSHKLFFKQEYVLK